MMYTIIRYEWKRMLRSKIAIGGWLGMLLIGCYSLYYGQQFQQGLLETAYQIDTASQARLDRQLLKFAITDTTSAQAKADYESAHDPFLNEYALQTAAMKSPAALQAMAIGQADNNAFYHNLWFLQNVYNNKAIEIRNPAKLRSGNFDLAFVIIFLLPLLIIAYTHDVLGEDLRTGVEKLMMVQGPSLGYITRCRVFFRALLVLVLALLLSLAGMWLNGAGFGAGSLAWLMLTVVYLSFWAAVAYFVIALLRSSTLAALALASVWIVFLLLLPALIQRTTRQHDPRGLEMAEVEREFSSQIWRMKPEALRDTLIGLQPHWKHYDFSDLRKVRIIAYYHLLMGKLNEVGRQRDGHLLTTEERLKWANFVNPGFAAQSFYNRLAQSESSDFVHFRRAASNYQQERSNWVNTFRLSGQPFTAAAVGQFPSFGAPQLRLTTGDWAFAFLPLLLLGGISLWGGARIQRKYTIDQP